MDPLSALSLAATVIQFVDFAHKLVSGSREIYKSATGLTDQNSILEIIADDVSERCDQIPDDFGNSNAGLRLQKLAAKSRDLAASILRVLDELKTDKDKPSKWQSFVHLLRSVHRAPQLQMLADQVKKLQAQVNSNLIYILR